jgi:hypothetical protein
MIITEHFDSDEFAQHVGYGFESEPYPPNLVESTLRPLCTMLEAIRAEAGGPISIISGYRSVAYNQAMYAARGESPTDSQHSRGKAADIRVGGMKAAELHGIIFDLYRRGLLPQLGGLGKYDGFVHVDIRQRIPEGHLAQWDYSTGSDDSGIGGGQSGASGDDEGDAEEDEDPATNWLIPLALVGVLVFFAMRGFS